MPNVFVSVGRTCNDKQEAFVREIEQLLENAGFQPRTLGRNEFSSERPLERVLRLMDEAAGAVVIALERKAVEVGWELHPKGRIPIDGQRIPTIWNQVEAAMAYALGLPLLVLVEEGLVGEGLLEERYDWLVQYVELTSDALVTDQFRGVFVDWAARARARAGGG